MTWQAAAWAMSVKAGSPTDKLVLLVICNHYSDALKAFVRQKLICQETELSERAVRDALKRLEAVGLIARRPQFYDDGKGGRRCDVIELPRYVEDQADIDAMRKGRAGRAGPAGAAGSDRGSGPAGAAGSDGASCRGERQELPGEPAGAAGSSIEGKKTLKENSKPRATSPASPKGETAHAEDGADAKPSTPQWWLDVRKSFGRDHRGTRSHLAACKPSPFADEPPTGLCVLRCDSQFSRDWLMRSHIETLRSAIGCERLVILLPGEPEPRADGEAA